MKISEEANEEVNRMCEEMAGDTYCDNNRLDEFGKDDARGSKANEASKPKEYSVYKYSKEIPLAEQIILGHESVFLQIIDDKPIISRLLDLSKEQNIILKPYQHGISGVASPIIPIKFRDMAEVEYFIKQAKKETIESIYFKHKSLWKNFVVTKDQNTVIFLAVDSVYSHFQDLFETTHYDLIYGPPGSGKGAILITFSLLGYRVVLAADLNGANLLDLYGSAEICQITIAEDELDDIHRDPDKHKIYKIGYDFTGTTQRTLDGNTSNRNNRLYSVYGFKIGAAENQIESRVLAGFNDRGFQFHSIKGNPRYSIKKALKEMMKPAEKQLPKYRKIISQLEYIRKLTFIFRMIHYDDMIEEVEANIDGRALELTGPQIRLFSSRKLSSSSIDQENTLLGKEILPALSEFLRQKGELTKKTLDGIVYDAIVDLISCTEPREQAVDIVTGKKRTLYTISNSDICDRVKELVGGLPSQNLAEQAFYSVEYGKITYKRILKLCRDRLMAEADSIGSGNEKIRALTFDMETAQKVGKSFEVVNKIEILTNKSVEEEFDTDDDEQQDREIWKEWETGFTDAKDKSGTMGRNYPSSEHMKSNDGIKQLVNNNASVYNYENSLVTTHIVQDNVSQSTSSTSISETSIFMNENNFENTICPQIDPKIVPSFQISEPQEQSSFEHKCPYCNIIGHNTTFSNTDLLERHVIQRHPGWAAYPGQPDTW
jgi:hypothetical protein